MLDIQTALPAASKDQGLLAQHLAPVMNRDPLLAAAENEHGGAG
jgi:hypothetical protein